MEVWDDTVRSFVNTVVVTLGNSVLALLIGGSFLSRADAQTMPLLVTAQNATCGPQWWTMSVLILLMIGLVIVLAIVLERYISRGLLAGAVKG